MKESKILDAIGDLPEDLLLPVERLRQRKRTPWVRWMSLAACLCLIVGIPLMWNGLSNGTMEKADAGSMQETPRESGVLQDSPLYSFEEDCEYGSLDMISAVFRGKVLEIRDGTTVLVEPLEGEEECLCSDKIEIDMQGMASVPEIRVGDIVEITYDGMIQESYPARIPKVISICVIE